MPGLGPDPDNQNLAQCQQKWYRASSWRILPDPDNPQIGIAFISGTCPRGSREGPSTAKPTVRANSGVKFS